MTPASFRLYDALNCAATAVDEDGSCRWADADRVWQAACAAAEDLFPSGSDAAAAMETVLRAATPSGKGLGRAELWNALNAASYAALIAMKADSAQTALLLNDLEGAVNALAPELREAMTVISREIGLLAMTAVAA